MLTWVKRGVRVASRRLGYDIVPLRSVKERDFAIHLSQLFRMLEIDCVFDVGANIGQYRDFLRNEVGFRGNIVSFEPVAGNLAQIRQRSKLEEHWLVAGCALGSHTGTMPINVMKSDQFSSFLQPNNEETPAYAGLNETAATELVEVQTLDQAFQTYRERLNFRRLYLKLDTQGFDMEVLRGGEAVLPMVYALQTEASVIPVYDGMPGYREAIDFLNERHFELTGMYPVSRDDGLRLIEFDCVMVNHYPASARQ